MATSRLCKSFGDKPPMRLLHYRLVSIHFCEPYKLNGKHDNDNFPYFLRLFQTETKIAKSYSVGQFTTFPTM